MKIAVAGTGYVGLSIATLLAQHHEVMAVDIIEDKVNKINNKISPIQDEYIEKYLKEKLYKIRGKRVLLDADLAEIYGYDTKGFNRQVKNNIEKFDEDFMFELTDDETEYLRTNFSTANISSKSRYNPHVFTEQGLYLLMTVLKGPLAVKQSKRTVPQNTVPYSW